MLLEKAFQRHWHRLINLWPPFLGAGIRVTRIAPGWREVDVEMKLRRWNRNYVGTHYGGSLYSMADPFFMLMLIENLGREYIVWDKSASIRFRKPGKGVVRAELPALRRADSGNKGSSTNGRKDRPNVRGRGEGRSRNRHRRGPETNSRAKKIRAAPAAPAIKIPAAC